MRLCFLGLLVGYSFLLAARGDNFTNRAPSKPFTERNFFRLGNRVLTLARHGDEEQKPFILLSLHNNEHTAIETGMVYVAENGGAFYQLINEGERNVAFVQAEQRYLFDPNRIFTYQGRKATLKMFRSWNEQAHEQVLQLARFILAEIPPHKTLVTLHNNTNWEYDLEHYKRGGLYYPETKALYSNPDMDSDDFFVTTDDSVYKKLSELNYNVVLQNNRKVRDDGSLSVYCARMNRKYVNIETEFGHNRMQLEMLYILEKVLK